MALVTHSSLVGHTICWHDCRLGVVLASWQPGGCALSLVLCVLVYIQPGWAAVPGACLGTLCLD